LDQIHHFFAFEHIHQKFSPAAPFWSPFLKTIYFLPGFFQKTAHLKAIFNFSLAAAQNKTFSKPLCKNYRFWTKFTIF